MNREKLIGQPESLSAAHSVIFDRLVGDLCGNPLFNEKEFFAESSARWQEYVPRPGRLDKLIASRRIKIIEEIIGKWSDLVPANLSQKEALLSLISAQWCLRDESLEGGIVFGKNLSIAGTMGTGKSGLATALEEANPLSSLCISERWEDNDDLRIFYQLLAICFDPACQKSPSLEKVRETLRQAQGKVQGWFAADEFRRVLMSDLERFSLIDDTPLGQDGVYFETQAELGLAENANVEKYRRDNTIRQLVLPPHLRGPSGLIFVWAPLDVVRQRISETRGRDFETRIPGEYIFHLQKNLIGWMLRMSAAGVPVTLVDASRVDFRPGNKERLPIAQKIWQWAEGLHR